MKTDDKILKEVLNNEGYGNFKTRDEMNRAKRLINKAITLTQKTERQDFLRFLKGISEARISGSDIMDKIDELEGESK